MWRGIFYNVRNPQLPSPPPRTVTDLWSVLGKKIRKVRWLNDFITRSCSWKKFSCKWSHIKHLSSTSKSKRIPKYCTPTAASPRPLESTLKFHIFQWSPPLLYYDSGTIPFEQSWISTAWECLHIIPAKSIVLNIFSFYISCVEHDILPDPGGGGCHWLFVQCCRPMYMLYKVVEFYF